MISSMLNFSLFTFTGSCLPLIVGERERSYLLTYTCYLISHNMCFSKSLFLPNRSLSGKRYWIPHTRFTQGLFLSSNNFYCTGASSPVSTFLSNDCKLFISLWVQILQAFSYVSAKRVDFHWLSSSYSKYVKHSQDSLRDYTVARDWQHGPWAPWVEPSAAG